MVYCSVAIMFLVATIYLMLTTNRSKEIDDLYAVMNEKQSHHFEQIVKERRDISMKGYLLGLVLAFILLFITKGSKIVKWSSTGSVCMVGAITLATNYFYYILHPKSDYMILHLEEESQRLIWLKVYRNMQVKYHIGLVLGIIASMFLAKSIC
jgi:Sec-independent protein secretion pathway component TatC